MGLLCLSYQGGKRTQVEESKMTEQRDERLLSESAVWTILHDNVLRGDNTFFDLADAFAQAQLAKDELRHKVEIV